MSIFVEKFVFPILATAAGAMALTNPMKFDLLQRVLLFVMVASFALFVGHTMGKTKGNEEPAMERAVGTGNGPHSTLADIGVASDANTLSAVSIDASSTDAQSPRASDVLASAPTSLGSGAPPPPSSVSISSTNQSGGITAQNVTINNAPPVETIDFNGAHRRSARPGQISVDADTPEYKTFKRMLGMEETKAWLELEAEALAATKRFPTWLTGYLFLGVSKANQGKLADAVHLFEYVTKNAMGDSAYDVAQENLDKIRAAIR